MGARLSGIGLLLAVALAASFAAGVEPEDAVAGGITFRRHCVRCHGAEGKGDGPAADNLRFLPADLTRIARRNGGKFPADRVRRIVDGRGRVKGHDGSDMPIFGDVFRNSAARLRPSGRRAADPRGRRVPGDPAGPLTAAGWYHPPRRPRRPRMAEPEPADPLIDLRTRWRAGQVLLAAAGLLTLVALARPLAPPRASWLRGGDALLLAIGIFGSALLALLRGSRRPEALALYAFLVLAVDALGQLSSFPVWPLMVLLIATQAVAERLAVALGFAAQASLLAAAQAAWTEPPDFRPALAAAVGYVALAVAIDRALAGREAPAEHDARRAGAGAPRHRPARRRAGPLRRAGRRRRPGAAPGDGRSAPGPPARPCQRAGRDAAAAARSRTRTRRSAHAVLYFDVDHLREQAHLRAACGPAALVAECEVPLGADPFSFLVERGQPFYATDFKRLLWELPWYRGTVRVGSLVALPVRAGESLVGALVADKLEIQAFSGKETLDPVRLRDPGRRGDPARPRLARPRGAGRRVQGRLPGVAEARDALARGGRAPGAARLRAPDRGARRRGDRRGRRAGDALRREVRVRLAGRVPGPCREHRRADLGRLGPAQRRGGVPARQRGGARGPDALPRAGRGRRPRRLAARDPAARGGPDARRHAPDRAARARSTPPRAACSRSWPTRPRPPCR